ncbi:2974_t:CDS:2 [Acaulospora colombiana]|uniref:2974_t:CDS:1 n=1 Tax=Acaulospora colombiana TaxID=27376 RepID=A0ACA9PXA8_9GLOM|nr:2974_t:CDS:2 [Acaulospora colombiana]
MSSDELLDEVERAATPDRQRSRKILLKKRVASPASGRIPVGHERWPVLSKAGRETGGSLWSAMPLGGWEECPNQKPINGQDGLIGINRYQA